ncbi:hypothetical protein ABPG75_005877 [Micractinium tetrahymenae]
MASRQQPGGPEHGWVPVTGGWVPVGPPMGSQGAPLLPLPPLPPPLPPPGFMPAFAAVPAFGPHGGYPPPFKQPAAATPAAGPSSSPSEQRAKSAAASGWRDDPPSKGIGKKASHQAVERAQQQVRQLFPRLQPALQSWLLHRLMARFAKVAEAELSAPAMPIVVPLANAVAAANSIAYGPARQVAEAAAELLAGLRQRFLAGEDLLGSAANELCGASGKVPKSGNAKHVTLLEGQADAGALAQAVMELLADPSLAAPNLPSDAVQSGSDAGRLLPPAPPPPQRGSIVPAPEPLQRLFPGGGGSSSKGASGLLQQLLSDALQRLDASSALAAGQADSGGQQLPLHVSPDIDFGTVAVSHLASAQLLQAAASAAAGLPSCGSGAAHSHAGRTAAAAGSLLDLLHLSSQQRWQQHRAGSRPPSSMPAAASTTAEVGSDDAQGTPAGSVLHFRQLVVENTSKADALWLLGGIAAPAFPHMLAAVDDARLFWLEGHRAVRLDPLQQHTISIALSSADCAARRRECGILQQLLLLVCAAPRHSRLAQQLGELQGVPFADLPAAEPGSSGSSGSSAAPARLGGAVVEATAKAAAAAARGGAPEAAAPAAPFRLFVVARRVTVALVDSPAELTSLLDFEARPYVPEHLRRLFDTPPDPATQTNSYINSFPAGVLWLLFSGAAQPVHAAVSGRPDQPLQLPAAHAQRGQATVRHLPPAFGTPAARLLQRYGRLLDLEEAAMEQDICRSDMWNVRLRLAVFSGASTTRYRLVSLAPQPAGAASAAESEPPAQRAGGLYRGPAVDLLQPRGAIRSAEGGKDPAHGAILHAGRGWKSKPSSHRMCCSCGPAVLTQFAPLLSLTKPALCPLQRLLCMCWACLMCLDCQRAAPCCCWVTQARVQIALERVLHATAWQTVRAR